MSKSNISQEDTSSSSDEEQISTTRQRGGKVITCILMGITILFIGSNTLLPMTSVRLIEITTGIKLEKQIPALLKSLYIGNILGCIFSALGFDYFELPKQKQIMLSFMLFAMALTTGCYPLCSNAFGLVVNIFVSGICIQFCMTGILAYCFGLFGKNCNSCMQFLFFMYTLGTVVTMLATSEGYSELHHLVNYTTTDHLRSQATQRVVSSHAIMASLIALVVVAWFCLNHFSPSQFMLKVPFDDHRKLSAGPGFFAFAVISTMPLVFFASLIEAAYPVMIGSFATSMLSKDVSAKRDIVIVFWSSYAFGRFVAVGLAYRCCSSPQFIVINLGLLLCSGCLLPLTNKEEVEVLWIATALLGLAAASLLPSTYVWLHAYIHINSKVIGVLSLFTILSSVLSTFWINTSLSMKPKGPLYCILLAPTLYATTFAIQAIVFKQVEHPTPRRRGSHEITSVSLSNNAIPRILKQNPQKKDKLHDQKQCQSVIRDMGSLKSSVQMQNQKTMKLLRNLEFPATSVIQTNHNKSLITRRHSDEL